MELKNILNLKWGWYVLITVAINVAITLLDCLLQNSVSLFTLWALAFEFIVGSIIAVVNMGYSNNIVHRISIGVAVGSIASFIIGFLSVLWLFSGVVC